MIKVDYLNEIIKKFNKDELLGILSSLIWINSQNPRKNEGDLAKFLKNILDINNIKKNLSWVEPGKSNLIAKLEFNQKGNILLYSGHMDTVPVGSNWSVNPFGGEIKENKIYDGLEASDMKSGIAIMLYLLTRRAKYHGLARGYLVRLV